MAAGFSRVVSIPCDGALGAASTGKTGGDKLHNGGGRAYGLPPEG